jgi:HD-GYP domain-containing protein (c-di-GMP phosphodiesterase class II)
MSDVGVEGICIFARDRRERIFTPEVWRGVRDNVLLNLTIPIDGFLCQVVMLEGRTMILDEFAAYPRAAEDIHKLSVAGFTHLTPVQLGGEAVALIVGGDKAGGRPLDQLDVHLLAVLARSAATSIRNAGVFDEVQRSFVDTTAQLVATVEARYENLAGHSARVHDLAMQIAKECDLPIAIRQTVSYAARLHDLGALEEYESLFGEDGVLDDEQRAALRERTSNGVKRILERSQMPEVADAVSHLNEYWDGSGLPEGLVGESIPTASRVVAVANAYDALTHARPHRPAYSPEEALLIIRNRAGHQFDPALVDILLGLTADQTDLASDTA